MTLNNLTENIDLDRIITFSREEVINKIRLLVPELTINFQHLNDSEVIKILELLDKYKNLFSKDISQPAADRVSHTIDT